MTPDLRIRCRQMVEYYITGYQIRAFGTGVVYRFKAGTSDNGFAIMNTTEAAECCDLLQSVGILMRRIDSGGSSQWSFPPVRT